MAAPQTALRVVPEPGETQQRITSSVAALADILGLKHGELAAMAGIDPDKLSKSLGMKRKLTLEETERLAGALGVPVVVLYDGGDELRRRARGGILNPSQIGPDDPGTRENAPTRWYGGTVTDLRARRVRPLSRAA